MIKTRTWILIFSVILILSLGAAFFLYRSAPEPQLVEILQDGKQLQVIDLSKVKNPYTLVIEDGQGGSNTVLVEPGRICIQEADCPDQVCVRRGWLSEGSSPIVCLPHRLVIQAVGGSQLDAVVD